jgi:hypothetical protein
VQALVLALLAYQALTQEAHHPGWHSVLDLQQDIVELYLDQF